jgi:hypothetical protein
MIRALLGFVARRFSSGRNALRCHLYLRKGQVIIPTLGRVPGGPHRDIEPVTVIDVSDADALRQAFRQTIARGNPPIGPYPRPNPPPVVLKHAGVKSWSAFARGASTWLIEQQGELYQIIGYRREPNNWAQDPQQTVDFLPGTTLDQVIDRMIAILQDAARQ